METTKKLRTPEERDLASLRLGTKLCSAIFAEESARELPVVERYALTRLISLIAEIATDRAFGCRIADWIFVKNLANVTMGEVSDEYNRREESARKEHEAKREAERKEELAALAATHDPEEEF